MKQELIVKSNTLLQQPLYKTSVELKLFSRVIMAIRDNPEELAFTFQIKDLLEKFQGGVDNYTELKRIAKKMFRVVDLNPSEKGFHLSAVFTDIFVHEEGIITFEVNKNIKPFLLNLTNNFTQYFFENIARLKSSFSIRIYELLKQYEKVGNRRIGLLPLRHFLSIENDKFAKYNDFKRFVLFVAQKELKEKTDICFDFEEIKSGRKISEINFIILRNNKIIDLDKIKETSENSLNSEQEELKNILIDRYKITKKTAHELVIMVKIELIKNNMEYAEKEYKNGKIKKSFGGYLLDAIKNNYAGNISIFEIDQKQRKVTEEKTKRIDNEREKLEFKLSKDFGTKIRADFIASLSEEEIKDLTNEIIEKVKTDKYTIDQIRRKGLLNAPATYTFLNQRIERFAEKKEQFIVEGLKKAGFES
jgi:plasmid replication initiation protein